MSVLRTAGPWLPLGLLCIAGVGCQSKLQQENLRLYDQNRELQARLIENDTKLRAAPSQSDLSMAQAEIRARDERIKQLEELQASLQKPTPGVAPDPGLAGIKTTYDPAAGTVTVNLPGDVLFDPGKAVVKSSAAGTLDKIVDAVNKSYRGKTVMVEGFTDSDPITKTRDQWDDNWDLSYARAKAVSQYLTGHGVDEKVVAIVANGANKPKGSKPASRRVEIVVSTR